MAKSWRLVTAIAVALVLAGAFSAAADSESGKREAKVQSWSAGTEDCLCPEQGDLTGEGIPDPVDVDALLELLYNQGPDIQAPDCPAMQSDINADGCTNLIDPYWLLNALFFGQSIIDPCSCPGGFPCQPPAASGTGSVVVGSKDVDPGASDVIEVFLNNSASIDGFCIPLVIREVTPGVYPTSLTPTYPAGTRIAGFLSYQNVVATYNNADGACRPSGFGTPGPLGPSSPDAILFVRQGPDPVPSGSDGDTPSIEIGFTAPLTEGQFEIDTTCIDPCHHLLFTEPGGAYLTIPFVPAFTKGTITVGTVPACDNSTCDRYFLACPKGDIAFEVELLDGGGTPMVGYSAVQLDFSDCDPTEFFPLPGAYPDWPIVPAPEPSDADGIIRFAIAAGGNCPDCSVMVSADCGFTKTVPVRCTDVDGNAWVQFADYDEGLGLCRDLNADGVVDDADYIRHVDHCCDHRFPGDPCDWLTQEVTLEPEGGFEPEDEILVRWQVDNNVEGSTCDIDSVVIYESEQTPLKTWERVAVLIRGTTLGPGEFDIDSLTYTVPDFGKMCLLARLYSSCCDPYQEVEVCEDVIRDCPPDSVCFQFLTLRLSDADWYEALHTLPLDLGWTLDTVKVGDTMKTTICTSDITPAGTDGTFTWRYKVGGIEDDFTYRIVQELFMGDMTGPTTPRLPDCFVDVFDMNLIIDLLFSGGDPPIPPENADLDCDGFPTALDMSIIIDILFANLQAPEPCDGGPG
jgi:hypothetical protein